jgi:glycosyltransferase involved in cell wall biosynthesis
VIPSISVLTPVYDGARFLADALASARAQTWPAAEIIVVDDGSRDDSAAIAAATPGVTCIRAVHAGVAAARNRALAAAHGDFIAFLDADDLWTADKLEVQVGHMLEHPELGFTFTAQEVMLEPGVARPFWLRAADIGRPLPFIGTGSMVMRRSVFELVGSFDIARQSAEDTDWVVRAIAAAVPMALLPHPLLRRRIHGANLSADLPLHQRELFALLRAQIARRRARPAP